jgi:hypothetical protein
MCDYSLHHVASRPAKIEDKLVVTKFNGSFTRGFAAVGEPTVAVCLLPGTEVAFEENVECEPSFCIGILPNKKISQRLARLGGNGGFQFGPIANRRSNRSTAKEVAAALKGFSQYSAYGDDTGLNSIATRAMRGAICFSSSSHSPAIVGSVKME